MDPCAASFISWLALSACYCTRLALLTLLAVQSRFETVGVTRAICVYCLLDADYCVLEMFVPEYVAQHMSFRVRAAKECATCAGCFLLLVIVGCSRVTPPPVALLSNLVCSAAVVPLTQWLKIGAEHCEHHATATATAAAFRIRFQPIRAAALSGETQRAATQRLRQGLLGYVMPARRPIVASTPDDWLPHVLTALINQQELAVRIYQEYLDEPDQPQDPVLRRQSVSQLRYKLLAILPQMRLDLLDLTDSQLLSMLVREKARQPELLRIRQEYQDALSGGSVFRAWLTVRC